MSCFHNTSIFLFVGLLISSFSSKLSIREVLLYIIQIVTSIAQILPMLPFHNENQSPFCHYKAL